jgi:5-oxoprolinase (ATP-hydrolysing)
VGAYYIIRMLFLDEFLLETPIPQNDGMIRPVKVSAPLGTIYNPRFPAACTARFCPNNRAADLVIKALAPLMPERATAGNSAVVGAVAYSGVKDGNYWIYVEVNEGAYGGRATKDGMDAVDTLLVNARNNPIEELDWHYPVRNLRYELDDRLPAAGKWRGGIGIVRENYFLTSAFLSSEAERASGIDLPHGIFGGKSGYAAGFVLNPGTPEETELPAKVEGRPVKEGDLFRFTSPSGGGYGDPFERDPSLVLEDYLDELATIETAEKEYGVAIDAASETVDEVRTAQLRALVRV